MLVILSNDGHTKFFESSVYLFRPDDSPLHILTKWSFQANEKSGWDATDQSISKKLGSRSCLGPIIAGISKNLWEHETWMRSLEHNCLFFVKCFHKIALLGSIRWYYNRLHIIYLCQHITLLSISILPCFINAQQLQSNARQKQHTLAYPFEMHPRKECFTIQTCTLQLVSFCQSEALICQKSPVHLCFAITLTILFLVK